MSNNAYDNEIDKIKNDVNYQKFYNLSKFSRYASLFITFTLFSVFIYGTLRLNSLYKELSELERLKNAETIKIQSLQFDNRSLETKKEELEKELMTTYGLSIDSIKHLSTTTILEKSLNANKAIKSLLSNFIPNNDITVYYYNKTIDEKRVAVELEALGYTFKVKPASKYMSRKETNAIWFGKGVNINDVKIVALALVRAGIPIKGIRPYEKSILDSNYKKYSIEVGASVDLEIKPLLTVEQIQSSSQFIR